MSIDNVPLPEEDFIEEQPSFSLIEEETETEYNPAHDMLESLPEEPAEIISMPDASVRQDPYPLLPPIMDASGTTKRILSRFRLIGVDITPHTVRVCHRNGKKIRLVEKHLEDVATWEDVAEQKEKVVTALKAAVKELKVNHKLAALSLPLSSGVLGRATFANMTGEALKDMVASDQDFWRHTLAKDINTDEYVIHYDVVSRNPEHDTMELMACGYKRDAADFFADLATSAGLRPTALDFRETTLMRLAEQINEPDGAPAAILQISPEENHVIIAHNGLPSHKEIVISDWDRVALTDGDAQLLDSVAARYADEFRAASAEMEATGSERPPSRLLLSSSVPLASAFVERLTESLPEVVFYAAERQEKPGGWLVKPYKECANDKPFSCDVPCMGLADRYPAHKESKPHSNISALNILPKARETGEAICARQKGFIGAAGLAAVVGLLVVGATLTLKGQKMMLESDLAEAKRLSSDYEQKLARAKELTGVTAQFRELRELPNVLPLNQETLAAGLRDIHESIPAGVWLDSFDFSFPYEVELKGNAFYDADILAFMNALSARATFAGITLKMMEAQEIKGRAPQKDDKIDARPVKNFRIKARFDEG